MQPSDSQPSDYVAKRYLILKATTDVRITVLFLRWLLLETLSATVKLKYESTLEELKYSQRNETYNSVG